MLKPKSTKVFALVLNTRSSGETDRVVTLICQKLGKVSTLAKGVRKSASNAAGALQAGNLVEGLIVHTKGWPILSQVKPISDIGSSREDLQSIKELFQVLEMIDALFVEEELDEKQFDEILELRQAVINKKPRKQILNQLILMIESLGFPAPDLNKTNLSEYVGELVGRKIKSFEYLSLKV